MQIQQVGLIGLGKMGKGKGMAMSLQRAGFSVRGLDANQALARQAGDDTGIEIAADLPALLRDAKVVVLSLPTSQIVQALLLGDDGLLAQAAPGVVLIDTTTGDPQVTRDMLPSIVSRGVRLVDAPVSGGRRGAAAGELAMFLGGAEADVLDATPVLAALGTKRFHIGAVGAGQVAKLVNNLLMASHLLTASEAFKLAEAAGVKTEQLIEAVNASSGRSGVTLYNYPSRILNDAFDSGFTMQLMRKDVRLALALMDQVGLSLPVSRDVGRIWADSASALADAEDFNRIVAFEPAP